MRFFQFSIVAALLLLAGAMPAQAQFRMERTVVFSETVTPLAGNATFTGGTHDLGTTGPIVYSTFGCGFNADQTGTGSVEDSTDGTTWLVAGSAALSANVRLDVKVPIRARYNRCKLVNGVTIQGSFRAVSSFSAN